MKGLRRPKASAGRLWQQPRFLRFWAAQTSSEFGTWMGAVPLLAVLVLDVSPLQMGLLEASRALPAVALGLLAGVWVDRARRRPILIGADLGRFVVLAGVAAAALLDVLSVAALCAAVLALGALNVLFEIAYRSFLPSLVARTELVAANARLSASASLAEVASPGVGGLVAQAVSAVAVVILDAISFLVSALALLSIEVDERGGRTTRAGDGVRAELAEGLAFVWGQRVLRTLLLASSTQCFFGGFFAALYALFVLRELALGPLVFGLLVGAGGVGALAGAALVGRVNRRFGVGPTLIASLLVAGMMGWLIPMAAFFAPATAIVLLAAQQLLGDVAFSIYLITQMSCRQGLTPDRLLGRVNAGFEFATAGAGACGMLLGGLAGELVGIVPALMMAVAGTLLACGWLIRSPVRQLRHTSRDRV